MAAIEIVKNLADRLEWVGNRPSENFSECLLRCQAVVRLEKALRLQSNQWIAKAATIALGNGKHF
jgi:hypothetical protein